MAKKTRTPRRSQNKFPMAGSSGGSGSGPDDIKMEFARRLQRAMVAKGWSQSEFARRCNAALPPPARGQKQHNDFRRDLVSHYVTGQHLPSAPSLAVMARVLGIEPGDLLPKSAFPEAGRSPFAMTTLSNGRVNLQINRTMSSETAMKIAKLLATEDAS